MGNGDSVVFGVFQQTVEQLESRVHALYQQKHDFGQAASQVFALLLHSVQHVVLVLQQFFAEIQQVALELLSVAVDFLLAGVQLLL